MQRYCIRSIYIINLIKENYLHFVGTVCWFFQPPPTHETLKEVLVGNVDVGETTCEVRDDHENK